MNFSTTHSRPTWYSNLYSYRLMLSALLILIIAVGWRLLQNVRSDPVIDTYVPGQFTASDQVTRFQQRLESNPDDEIAYAKLGLALLQRVRQNGDVSLYMRARQAFDESLQRDPKQIDAQVGQGVLALALHDFGQALEWAQQVQAINPWRSEAIGIMVDSYVELGRYDEAVSAAQQMVDLRPGLESYSRVSYMRELFGDVEGAIVAMKQAVEAGMPGTESSLWTQVQLGHLYFNRGDLATAEAIYRSALDQNADYVHARAGLGRVQAAMQDYARAIETYIQVTQRLPLPEYVIALGDLYEVTGQYKKAAEQRELVNVIQQLNATSGMNVDLELAYFDVEYGQDPAAALDRVQSAYEARPTIYAADAVAWALYKNGRFEEAEQFSQEARRLNTQDALLYYHASIISQALGDETTAEAHLMKTVEINPYFSIRYQHTIQELIDS